MHRLAKTAMLLALILPMFAAPVDGEIVRVARRYSVIDFYGGSSSPVGKYDGLAGFVDFTGANKRPADVDADVLFDPTVQLGIRYGELRNSKMLLTIGLRWTKVEAINLLDLNTVSRSGLAILLDPKKPGLNQYDLDFNFNYLFMNIVDQSFSPYIGVGFRAGVTTVTAKGFSSESHINTVLAANVGAELKLWESEKKRSFLTLASVNSYDLIASGDRPKYLNIGGALKYYFRP
jgi:hypothetical protein